MRCATRRIRRVQALTNPQLFTTQFRSPQLLLWELGPDDWHLVIRLPDRAQRRPGPRSAAMQLSWLPETSNALAEA